MKKIVPISILATTVLVCIIYFIFSSKFADNEKSIENSVEEMKIVEEFVQIQEEGIKVNTSTQLSKTKYIDNLEITNIQLINKGDQSILTADVTNIGSNTTKFILVKITMIDKNGEEIGTLTGIIGDLEANQTTQLNVATQDDYSNAYDFKVEKE